ncbi:MAG: metallophosphoesterase [bacterium]
MKYVVSDIHGRLDKYADILQLINFSDKDELYILGDVIDRGPDGVDILKSIINSPNIHMLMGNHELMAVETIFSTNRKSKWEKFNLWDYNGGAVTYHKLMSLNFKELTEIVKFLINLPASIEINAKGQKFHLVHGFHADNIKDQVWTRPTLNKPNPFTDKTLIIGHTPVMRLHGNTSREINNYIMELRSRKEHLKIEHTEGFIAIDCGCSNNIPEARLACLRLDDMEEFYT